MDTNSKTLGNPAGTVDLIQKDIFIRNYIFDKAKHVLNVRGATQIETPVVELLSTVESLYGGEFNKLVYNLTDEGQKLILRYDLTVPLARFVGSNGLLKFRRFQYGKVYRRDNPQIQKGRYREFYQFDYDIIGDDQQSGTNDLEMLDTLNEMLIAILGQNTFTVKFNYKDIVVKILEKVKITPDLFSIVFSAIDKLDKKTFGEIKLELEQKGVSLEQIDMLEKMYILLNNTTNTEEITSILKKEDLLTENAEKYLGLVNAFLSALKVTNFKLDPFLIRGMDYYTGLLYEVTYNDKSIMESTISAGGRYDGMIGKFSTRGNIPAIGMSLGIERIVKILENTTFKDPNSCNCNFKPDVYVASIGKNMIVERVLLCSELRKLGYKTSMSDLANPSMRLQFDSVFTNQIPVMVIIGSQEIANDTVNIKDVNKSIQTTIKRNEIDQFIKQIT